jgi:hypothetical protein
MYEIVEEKFYYLNGLNKFNYGGSSKGFHNGMEEEACSLAFWAYQEQRQG